MFFMKISYKPRLVYMQTFYNALFVNDFINSFQNCNLSSNKHIVFASQLRRLSDEYPFVYKLIFVSVLIFWPIVFFSYMTFLLVKSFVFKIFTKKKMMDKSTICFLSDDNLLKRMDFFDGKQVGWLLLPWMKKVNKIPHEIQYSVFNILSFKQIFACYLYVLYVYLPVIKRFGYTESLYILNGYEWFLCYETLMSVPLKAEVYISNQKDRWALMIDKLPYACKNVIQHGTNITKFLPAESLEQYFKYDSDYNFWYLYMPQRLSNIKKLYAFNEREATSVIRGELKCVPEVINMGYDLNLAPVDNSKSNILIVGNNVAYEVIEKKIIQQLQGLNISIYLKPHPLNDISLYESWIETLDFVLIRDKTFYPQVDFVFSYNSTLANQYEDSGFKVLFYDDIDIDNVKKYIFNSSISRQC